MMNKRWINGGRREGNSVRPGKRERQIERLIEQATVDFQQRLSDSFVVHPKSPYDARVEVLGITPIVRRALHEYNIHTIQDLLRTPEKTLFVEMIRECEGFGIKRCTSLVRKLHRYIDKWNS